MKKLFTLLIGVFLSLSLFAQIGLSMTLPQIKALVKSDETSRELTVSGIKVLEVENPFFYKRYFFTPQDGICCLYSILPKDDEARASLEKVANLRYTIVNDSTWTLQIKGQPTIICCEKYVETVRAKAFFYLYKEAIDDDHMKNL